jgi:hypothetical protein
MTTPTRYRDARRPRVAAARVAVATLRAEAAARQALLLAGPNPDAAELASAAQALADLDARLAPLIREADALAAADWSVADATFELVARLRVWEGGPALVPEIEGDPVRQALGEPHGLKPSARGWLAGLARTPGDPPGDLLDQARAATGGDAAAVDELVFAGFRAWLGRGRPYPFEDVAVLLPVRLETLFDATPQGEVLSLRVLPDEASVLRDNPTVAPAEAAALTRFWAVAKPASPPSAASFPASWLDAAEGRVAWEAFSAAVGPRRAAWLVASFPPTLAGGEAVVAVTADPGPPLSNRVSGLPAVLAVFAVDRAGATREVGRLTRSGPPGPIDVPLPGAGVEEITESWWGDFTKAKDLGLAGKFLLRDGLTRDTIEALYVVGVGDEAPGPHFRALADAGDLGFLRPGAATNSVRGAQAAELARDPETWRAVAARRLAGPSAIDAPQRDAVRALVGSGAAVPFVPGSSADLADARAFVRALWPALWGHHLRDIWGVGDAAHAVGLWACDHLAPEGPLLPVRVADQPYGLLPATSLASWQPADASPEAGLEVEMVRRLGPLRDIWRDAARARGSSMGADAGKFLDLLGRDGVTSRYVARQFLPTKLLALLYPAAPAAAIVDLAERAFEQASRVYGRPPVRFHLPSGDPHRLDLPLIAATRRPFRDNTGPVKIAEALDKLAGGLSASNLYQEALDFVVPDSLLIRLMFESLVLTQAWYVQSVANDPTPLLDDPVWAAADSVVERKRRGFADALAAGTGSPAMTRLWKVVFESQRRIARELDDALDGRLEKVADPLRPGKVVATMRVPPERLARWERALRATLDSASHRLDPWVVGVARRRLAGSVGGVRGRHRLGVYGWLDGPFQGKPGPTPAGLLHAPSHPQAVTAAILRDKFLSSAADVDAARPRNLWEMTVDSRRARAARHLAEDAALGVHLMESVGRQVEGVLGSFQAVEAVRMLVPMEVDKPDRHAVCQGLAALAALRTGTAPGLPLDPAKVAALRAGLSAAQKDALDGIDAALDAYGDLLVADAVHAVVTGHPDLASQIMDAAAGLGRPPTFESLDTPPSGYILSTTVLSAVPAVAPAGAADADAHPCRTAEPSLAAYLDRQFAAEADRTWTIRYTAAGAAGPVEKIDAVSIAVLGLTPAEAALTSPELIGAAMVALRGGVRLLAATPPAGDGVARTMWADLGGQPTTARVLSGAGPAAPGGAALDAAARADLGDRFTLLRAACESVAASLRVAGAPRPAALRRALGFGVAPALDPADQGAYFRAVFGGPAAVPASDGPLLDRLALAAAASLAGRLEKVPSAPPRPVPDLARAIAELTTADGKLSVLTTWDTGQLLAATGLRVGAEDPALDRDWLPVVAAVRPGVARLEALQLGGRHLGTHAPLRPFSNSADPGDPWRLGAVGRNRTARESGAFKPAQFETPALVAAYGEEGVWQAPRVAVGLIDEFGEHVPMEHRTGYAAFGFNAPAARPPQAILLAVPGVPRTLLDEAALQAIVAETRALAHARSARPEDLGPYQLLVPNLWFRATGLDRVRLDAGSQFTP